MVARHHLGAITTNKSLLVWLRLNNKLSSVPTIITFITRVHFQLVTTLAGNSHSLVRVSRRDEENIDFDVNNPKLKLTRKQIS